MRQISIYSFFHTLERPKSAMFAFDEKLNSSLRENTNFMSDIKAEIADVIGKK